MRFWRDILNCDQLNTVFRFPPNITSVTQDAYQKAADRYLGSNHREAARTLGRALLFYRAYNIYDGPLMELALHQRVLGDVSDEDLAGVLGFHPSESLVTAPEYV